MDLWIHRLQADAESAPWGRALVRALAVPVREHRVAVVWLAVLPTLTVLNLTLWGILRDQPTVLRTFLLAMVAVPIVIYGGMPHLHRLRGRVLSRHASAPGP